MEPTQKKFAQFWWLVAVNYITSFIVAALIIIAATIIILFAVASTIGVETVNRYGEFLDTGMGMVFMVVTSLLVLWFTTWQSARFLGKRYVIPSPQRVVLWTAGIYVVLAIIGYTVDFMRSGYVPGIFEIGSSLASLLVFYLASSKYLNRSTG